LNKSNIKYFDEQFDKELVLLSTQEFNHPNIKHININKYKELIKIFNNLNIKALILRPDRFILSSLQKNSDINKFVNKSMLQFS
jgi:hypothetical protein